MKSILAEINDRIDQMPQISSSPQKLLMKLVQDDYAVSEIVQIIESDVSLTTRCLKVVNSPAFGLRNHVASIRQSVTLLGSSAILSIAISQGFKHIFKSPMIGYQSERGEYWQKSLRTAIASKTLAEQLPLKVKSDVVYTAGLLLDIGKAIISEFLEKYHSELLSRLVTESENGKDFIELEQSILDTDHTIVGETLATKWGFPEVLRTAIRYHHHPSEAPKEHREMVMIVHMGDIFSMLSGAGCSLDSLCYKLDPEADELIKFNKTEFVKLFYQIDLKYKVAIEKMSA